MRQGSITGLMWAVSFPGLCILALVALGRLRQSSQMPIEDGHESEQLVAPGGADEGLGESIALDSTLALVGAPLADNHRSTSGTVYVFSKNSEGKWTNRGKLGPHQATAGDLFGASVALHGSTALIGAPEDNQRGEDSGAAYLFQMNDQGAWKQIAKWAASDAAADGHFGHSVALRGDTAVVGSPGEGSDPSETHAAYVFQNDVEGNWNEVAKLTPDDLEPDQRFGCAVAVDGRTAVVGALGDSTIATNAGSAYVFSCDRQRNWRQVAKLTAADATAKSLFGRSLALSGDTLLVGACGDSSTHFFAGAAYVFRCDGLGSWRQVAKLIAADAEACNHFGWSVALSGDTALVGAVRRHDFAGAVYAFHADAAGHWQQTGTYSARDAQAHDLLGSSLALSGDTVLAGAPQHDATAANSGAAYVFHLRDPQ